MSLIAYCWLLIASWRSSDRVAPESRHGLIRRHRRAAFAKRKLHHHGVEPAAEFEADIRGRSDHVKAAACMEADRPGVGGIADDRDHLPVATALACVDQPLHQLEADAAAMAHGIEVNRILDRETI